MKKINDYLLLWVLVMFTLPFMFVSKVKADDTNYVYISNYAQYFGQYGVFSTSYWNYTGFDSDHFQYFKSYPLGTYYGVFVNSLANISNIYQFKGSFTINFQNEYTPVPDQSLSSCLYLAQNSNTPRSYMANCFRSEFTTDMNATDLKVSIMSSESLSLHTDDDGTVTVGISDLGSQYMVTYSFNVTFTEVNRGYFFRFDTFTNGGYLYLDPDSTITVLMTTPAITTVPYFTADNSLFSKFFAELNFNMHGLSSIVTSPIALANSFSSNGTNSISFTLFRKSFTIPNGVTLFWGRSDVSSFRVIWNTFLGGFILYFVYKKLFYFILGLFNPEDTKVVTL